MQRRDSMTKTPQHTFNEICGLGSIAKDNSGFLRISFRRYQSVEKCFAMGKGHLEISLLEGWWDASFVFCGYFCDEDRKLVRGARHGFEGSNLGGDRGCEEECLASCRRGKRREASFHIREHASRPRCKKPVSFIKNNNACAVEATDRVCPGAGNMIR